MVKDLWYVILSILPSPNWQQKARLGCSWDTCNTRAHGLAARHTVLLLLLLQASHSLSVCHSVTATVVREKCKCFNLLTTVILLRSLHALYCVCMSLCPSVFLSLMVALWLTKKSHSSSGKGRRFLCSATHILFVVVKCSVVYKMCKLGNGTLVQPLQNVGCCQFV